MNKLFAFRNWKIRTKILTGYAVVAVVAVVVGANGLMDLGKAAESQGVAYDRITVPTREIGEMALLFQQGQVNLRDLILSDDAERNLEIEKSFQRQVVMVDSLSARIEATMLTEEGLGALNRFREARAAYAPLRDQVMQLAAMDFNQEADSLLEHEMEPLVHRVETALEEVIRLKADIGERMQTENAASLRQAQTVTLGLLLFGVLFALFVGMFTSRIISRPVSSLADAARKVRNGDLSVTVTAETQEEVGSLGRSFNEMVANIRRSHEEVQAEKASVEARVEEAVRESEENRRYLSASVDRILVEMERFAGGDLTTNLEVEREDEIGRLYAGFNKAVGNIRDMLGQVGIAVDSAASASGEISASAEQLATAAQEQSVQSGEAAAAVEEMVRTIVENSQNASGAADVAGEAGKVARKGGEVVLETVRKIRQIADVVKQSAETVERLGESSRRIGEIVSVINEIADQTNLLALNAAIEAARAGEQGRGFAVVADEVRKLAERTTGATREIAGMIKGIQNETHEAVRAMQKGNDEVAEGIRLADRAGEALEQVVEGAASTVDRITQIAAASEEQSATSEQIARSVEGITGATQESALGVQQIARAADGLSRLTEDLRRLMERFQTGHDRRSERPATPSRHHASTWN